MKNHTDISTITEPNENHFLCLSLMDLDDGKIIKIIGYCKFNLKRVVSEIDNRFLTSNIISYYLPNDYIMELVNKFNPHRNYKIKEIFPRLRTKEDIRDLVEFNKNQINKIKEENRKLITLLE